MKPIHGVLLALAIVAGAACQTSGGLKAAVAKSQAAELSDSTKVTIKVENNGFWDVTMYVLPETGTRMRLGTANGHSTTVLTLPDIIVQGSTAVRFIADPIGGGRASTSDQVLVSPGDEITLTLPPS